MQSREIQSTGSLQISKILYPIESWMLKTKVGYLNLRKIIPFDIDKLPGLAKWPNRCRGQIVLPILFLTTELWHTFRKHFFSHFFLLLHKLHSFFRCSETSRSLLVHFGAWSLKQSVCSLQVFLRLKLYSILPCSN